MRPLRRRRAAPVAAVGLAWLAFAAPSAALDLAGTWHVLVHYKDSAGENPELPRWEDRVWVFEPEGSRLRWIDYPIVVFRDESGRFEQLGSNRASRILHYWEPNDGQLAQIRNGLEINTRGSKSKTLRGSPREGWRSASPSAAFGGNVLTYTESWSIEAADGLPVFRFEDSLGGPGAESFEGVTEYRTTEAEDGGDVLRGSYSRDGTRTGTFRLMRSGATSVTKGSGKSEGERFNEMFFGQLGAEAGLANALGGNGADPRAVRAEVVKAIEQSMRERELDPRRYRAEIDDLADQIMREVESGKSPAEIQRMLEDGKLLPTSMRQRR
jgi:hypothetical protein